MKPTAFIFPGKDPVCGMGKELFEISAWRNGSFRRQTIRFISPFPHFVSKGQRRVEADGEYSAGYPDDQCRSAQSARAEKGMIPQFTAGIASENTARWWPLERFPFLKQ